MITERLVTHVMTAIATANLFLFQMAMLNAQISAWFGKDSPGLERMEGDVRANHNQEGSADKAHVGSDLENAAKSFPVKDQKITHNLKCDKGLKTVTSQGTGNMRQEADSEMGCTTHLTIHWTRNVKTNEVKNYGEKKGCARK
jgi:hypothetical protein